MQIGIPKETKNHEARVGMTPFGVLELVQRGHKVLVQTQAGLGIGFTDEHYLQSGATIAENAESVYGQAEMIVKVNGLLPLECKLLQQDQLLFSYLHLTANPTLAKMLLSAPVVAIGYETVTNGQDQLPLLVPTSEVTGRMAVLVGARALEKLPGGRGILIGGVPGVAPGRVVVFGGGVTGLNAARTASALGAETVVLDKSLGRLREIDMQFGRDIRTQLANTGNIDDAIRTADMVIGTVPPPTPSAPRIVTRAMLKNMKPGAVLVDAAIDQGGCFETSRPTTTAEPTYIVDGVVHCCISNMPAGVARTATLALTNATLPYVLQLADLGWHAAIQQDIGLRHGLNVCHGQITHPVVAAALDLACADIAEITRPTSSRATSHSS